MLSSLEVTREAFLDPLFRLVCRSFPICNTQGMNNMMNVINLLMMNFLTIITCSLSSRERTGKLSIGLISRKPPVCATAFAIRITIRGT